MRIKIREKRIQRNIPVDSVFSAQPVHHGPCIAMGAYYKIGFEFGDFFFNVFEATFYRGLKLVFIPALIGVGIFYF